MLKALFTYVFVLFVFTGYLFGQSPEKSSLHDPAKALSQYNIDFWGIDDGTSSNTINNVHYGTDGYLWFGTFNGIMRFDGFNFKLYTENDDSDLKTNGIRSIFEDSRKNIWLGTNGEGLIKCIDGNFIRFGPDEVFKNGLVTSIDEDKNADLWVGTRSGVYKFSGGTFSIPKGLERLADVDINTVLVQDDALWIGTSSQGLFQYKNETLTQFSVGNNSGLLHNSVRTITYDRKRKLWIGTSIGVQTLYNGEFTKVDLGRVGETIVSTIKEDAFGAYWIGTSQGLVKLYDGKIDNISKSEGLSDNIVQDLDFDKEGNIWLATYQGGVNRLKNGKFLNFGIKEGLPDNIVNVVYDDYKESPDGDNRLLVGTNKGLSIVTDDSIKSYSLGSSSLRNRIRDIYRDSRGHLWLCSYDGLLMFSEGKVLKRYSEKDGLSSGIVRVITEDKEGRLWIGTGNGLCSMKDGVFKNYSRSDGLQNNFIMSLCFDKDGYLWVGTDGGGLHRFKDGEFEHFGVEEGLLSNVVFRITEDTYGDLWIGTSGGLSHYSKGVFSGLTISNNLLSNTVFQALCDKNEGIWLMTNIGVQYTTIKELESVINGEKLQLENFEIYNSSEGMRSSIVTAVSNATISHNDIVQIPTLNGFTQIDPSNIKKNDVPPPMKIETVYVNRVEQSWKDSDIIVPPGRQDIEIDYSGLSFYAPRKVVFKYKLEPFDKEWIEVGDRRTAYYTNVPVGNYVFKVLAANNDGVWSSEAATLSLKKEAYFYELKEFYYLMVLLAALGVFLVYRVRTRYLKTKNNELQLLVDNRTSDLLNQKEELRQLNAVKDKLFSVISHDLRGPLNSLVGVLNLSSSNSVTTEEMVKLTENIGGELMKTSGLLDNLLVWAKSQMKGVKLERVPMALSELITAHIDFVRGEASKKHIKISSTIVNEMVFADPEVVKLILRNLLANAVKFTPLGGEISISAITKDEFVEVSIKDNGNGISEEDLQHLFSQEHYSKSGTSNEIGSGLGLMLCKEFVEMEGGEIWAESELGKGSTFTFKLRNQAS